MTNILLAVIALLLLCIIAILLHILAVRKRIRIAEQRRFFRLMQKLEAIEIQHQYILETLTGIATEPAETVQPTPSITEPPQNLTPTELRIAELIANGLSSKQIGTELSITESTVKTHRYKIFSKLRIRKSVELISRLKHLRSLFSTFVLPLFFDV